MKPPILILRAAGTNCDLELEHGFALAGAHPERLHINTLAEAPDRLKDYKIIAIPGGFSYGDDVSAGRIFANQLLFVLGSRLIEFVDRGGLVIGICNGFQILLKMGLLPGGDGLRQRATFAANDSARFEDRWVRLKCNAKRSVWIQGNGVIELPIAHGEGKFVPGDDRDLGAIRTNDQIALRYCDEGGEPSSYPANPNGSVDGVAGLCDPTGRVLGLMPHPERFIYETQHPNWTRRDRSFELDGLKILRNGVSSLR
jgi:phosphoribosylformylglycinamidine synthase